MTLTVEDGTIVENANSYVDTTDLIAFAAARGIEVAGDEEELLIIAMDYIESLSFIGTKKTADQSLQWPRNGVYIDSYLLDNDTIPNELKNGLMQCAIAIDQGQDPLANIIKNVRRQKLGDMEIEYSPNSVVTETNKKIISALRKLLHSGSSSLVVNKG